MQSLIKRVPIVIGPLIGGVLIDRYGVVSGVRIGLLISIVTGLVGLLVQRQIQDDPFKFEHGVGKLSRGGAELRSAAAPAAVQRHPGALLRADSLRVGGDLCHG